MNLSIKKFKNIYGIKDLKGIANINSNALIYAPNGGTKTSFALGMKSISKAELPRDRIYDKDGEYEIEFDGKIYKNTNLEQIDNIIVYNFDNYIDSSINLKSNDLSLLTISSDMKARYGSIYNSILEQIDNLANKISNQLSNKKKTEDNKEIVLNFFNSNFKINNWKDIIKFLSELDWEKKFSLNYPFFDVFNENTLPIIESSNFVEEVKTMNESINSKAVSNLFGDKFGSIEVSKLIKELSTNGFFEAGHALKINNIDELVDSLEKFQKIYEDEKKKIYSDENTKKIVENLLSKINKNKSTKAIRTYISDPEVLSQMEDVSSFILKAIAGILEKFKDEIIFVNEQIIKSNESIKELISESKNQKTKWESVCETFNERFDVPFKIIVKNKFNSMIGSTNPIFVFIYNNHDEEKEIDENLLKKTLSTGEKRALTVLYFLFDLFMSVEKNVNTFIILDDIVDSFDYKNKYAMIEYISDLSKNTNITCWILTHNFDFFSSCKHRVNNYEKYYIKKNKSSENFEKFKESIIGGGMELFANWKEQLKTDSSEQKFLALIPVARNIIELKYDSNNIKYNTLCDALHYRKNTENLTVADLKPIFKEVFDINLEFDSNTKIFNILDLNINKLLTKNLSNSIELDEKIIFSIAIRLLLEKIFNKIDSSLINGNLMLGEEYNLVKSKINDDDKKIINKAIISIPEFIHLNSFMYEPLVDVTTTSLQKLYQDIALFKDNY